ncbi:MULTISPECIES: YfiR/HmsC family protein [unclassified Algibacter]|uniref:YfiR/HmsC family protein n=1 Tax=unclassified Algibacter TaxID=2615009 RepID=UPI00131BB70A|nr:MULTISPECIES: YfiR/HmsC family protein [unclassified Algibacter]MCL5129138.1 YfiR family protein [Algibacter sp. L4_22]
MINLNYPKNKIFLAKGLFFVFIFLCWGNSVFSQNIPVPERIQAALLTKVLKYDSQIPQNIKIKILVVFDDNSELNKDEFITGLGNSMMVKAIRENELEQNISNYSVVYFMPGIQDYSEICKNNRVLSVTGISQYVEQGKISLGFGIQNNKPKILVNLTSLDKEGQSFSSDILRIAKIFN